MGGSASAVHMIDMSGGNKSGLRERLGRLMEKVIPAKTEMDRRLTAVKIHFGETGNNAYVRPVYASWVVDFLKKRGGRPFLTDSCTLYVGSRGDAVSHQEAALRNGFDPAVVGAPVIISGGLMGTRGISVPVYGKHFEEVEIVPEILDADVIVGITHFKGHEMSGFGGTLKNFGMGAATRKGKLAMHSRVSPQVKEAVCTGCGQCLRWCDFEAISMEDGKARIDGDTCSGCGACLAVCPEGAINLAWNEQTADMQGKMVEYACGALKAHLPERACFLNFITQVSPLCDCYPFADSPIVPDLGILASRDPVALDQASVDLVNAAAGLRDSSLPEEALPPGEDKFRALHPKVDWEIQLDHAVSMGLGTRQYELNVL